MNYITNDNLEVADIEVFEIVEAELARQTNHLEMIASENYPSFYLEIVAKAIFREKKLSNDANDDEILED